MKIVNDYEETQRFLNEKIEGAQFDSFEVFSTVIVLVVLVSEQNALKKRYISLCGDMSIIGRPDVGGDLGKVAQMLYTSIGENVNNLKIEQSGTLTFALKDVWYAVGREEDGYGDITWSVTSNSPSVFCPQDWSISLDDTNLLVMSVGE